MTMLHCDNCDRPLGTYLFGKGGIEERAVIGTLYAHRLPDIICRDCLSTGRPKKVRPEKERKFGINEFTKHI